MKNKFFLIVSFVLIIFIDCFAKNFQEFFLKANDLYEKKEYEKAFKLYDSIDKKGPATWFNMGNCAFKLENYVDSIIYWQKAKYGSPSPQLKAIEKNIYQAYKKLGKEYKQDLSDKVYDRISLISLFWLQLFFMLFWFQLFVFWFWLKKWRIFTLSTVIFFTLFFGAILLVKYRSLKHPLAIVKNSVSLFSGPDKDYHVIKNISAADEIRIGQKDGHWYKVKHNGVVGWVLSDNIEII